MITIRSYLKTIVSELKRRNMEKKKRDDGVDIDSSALEFIGQYTCSVEEYVSAIYNKPEMIMINEQLIRHSSTSYDRIECTPEEYTQIKFSLYKKFDSEKNNRNFFENVFSAKQDTNDV